MRLTVRGARLIRQNRGHASSQRRARISHRKGRGSVTEKGADQSQNRLRIIRNTGVQRVSFPKVPGGGASKVGRAVGSTRGAAAAGRIRLTPP